MVKTVSKNVLGAGMAKVKQLAEDKGDSWALDMISEDEITSTLAEVYLAMRAAETKEAQQ
jgi:hypothetical protein